jgi:hypothetical protein
MATTKEYTVVGGHLDDNPFTPETSVYVEWVLAASLEDAIEMARLEDQTHARDTSTIFAVFEGHLTDLLEPRPALYAVR